MNRRIKILYIHHAVGIGGAPISLANLIEKLDKNKFEPFVLLLKKSDVEKILKERKIDYKVAQSKFYQRFYKYYVHIENRFFKWYQIPRHIWSILSWFLSVVFFASRELRNFDVDIVHLNSSVLTDFAIVSKRKGFIVVQHIRESLAKGYFGIRLKVLRYIYKKSTNHIIAISKANARRLKLEDRVTIVYNFIDNKKFIPSDLDYTKKQIMYMGGASLIKGFETVVKCLEYLDLNITILFCGYYPNLKSTKNGKVKLLVEKMRKSGNAIEVGIVTDVQNLLAQSLCLINPFVTPHFSRPAIEAFALKRCVIASNIEGMDEIVEHNINGILIEPNKPQQLATAINHLVNNPISLKEYGENGYKKALSQFFPDANVKKTEDLYFNLISHNDN